MSASRHDPCLGPGETRGRHPKILDGHSHQRHRHSFACGEQHVQFPWMGSFRDLRCKREKLIGVTTHRAHNGDDMISVLVNLGDSACNIANQRSISNRCATVLVNHQRHCSTSVGVNDFEQYHRTMRIHRIFVLSAAVAMVAAACSSTTVDTTIAEVTTQPTTTTTAPSAAAPSPAVPSDYSGYLQQPAACGAEQPTPVTEMTFSEPDDVSVVDPTIVTLRTSCGDIEILMDQAGAPDSVNSFVFLAQSGYFDGSVSHRIVPGFMMQAGDPTATGLGGPGYAVPDEYPDEPEYTRGVVAMANAGPGTTGSQFFILFGDATWLPPSFTIIGEVTDGFETLDLIEQIPLGRAANSADSVPSTPLQSLFIESASVSG